MMTPRAKLPWEVGGRTKGGSRRKNHFWQTNPDPLCATTVRSSQGQQR